MAVTRIADLVYGPLFLPTVIQRTSELSTIRNSGIVSADAQIQTFANGPGNVVEIPFWNDLQGDSNVSSDDPAQKSVPNKIYQGFDQGRKLRRNNSWSSANLTASLAAEDPLNVVASLIGEYWDREEQTILLNQLNGIFSAASMVTNTLPVATEDGLNNGVRMDAEVAANAYAVLGDHGKNLTGVITHSRVYWNLHAQRALVYNKDPATGLSFTTWDDKNIIANDRAPRVAGATSGFKYTSYLFGPGQIAYAEATGAGGPKKPVELFSSPDAGNGEGVETVYYRRHWVMHCRGVKFVGNIAGESATNAELATGTTWERVYDPKLIRMVAVTTNG